MKLQEVNYRQPLGKLSGTGERLPRGPRAYPKPPKIKKAAPLPRPEAKKSYEGYSKGIDKTIKQIQSALKLRHARAKKRGHYDEGPELFGILADLQDVVKSIEADK